MDGGEVRGLLRGSFESGLDLIGVGCEEGDAEGAEQQGEHEDEFERGCAPLRAPVVPAHQSPSLIVVVVMIGGIVTMGLVVVVVGAVVVVVGGAVDVVVGAAVVVVGAAVVLVVVGAAVVGTVTGNVVEDGVTAVVDVVAGSMAAGWSMQASALATSTPVQRASDRSASMSTPRYRPDVAVGSSIRRNWVFSGCSGSKDST